MTTATAALALHGGNPVRTALLPYSRQSVTAEDREAVARALDSEWLTTGPTVAEFERAFAAAVESREAVAVSSGTAALHLAMLAAGVGPGDEVLVPAITFVASANSVLYAGATPVPVDVDAGTLLLDLEAAGRCITTRTRAVVAVDYAGQPCDYAALERFAARHGLTVIADACHAIGARDQGRAVGSLASMTAFSFHPVKPMTTAEGGMITTGDAGVAQRLRQLRSHGITSDWRDRETRGSWAYEMTELGFNYRLTDLQCALGLSQLRRVEAARRRREEIAESYQAAFRDLASIVPLARRPGTTHAWHLYVVQLELEQLRASRAEVFAALRAEGIGVNVHYLPFHLHPYYRQRVGTRSGQCPAAEQAYERLLSLPCFAGMTDGDIADVIAATGKIARAFAA